MMPLMAIPTIRSVAIAACQNCKCQPERAFGFRCSRTGSYWHPLLGIRANQTMSVKVISIRALAPHCSQRWLLEETEPQNSLTRGTTGCKMAAKSSDDNSICSHHASQHCDRRIQTLGPMAHAMTTTKNVTIRPYLTPPVALLRSWPSNRNACHLWLMTR